MKKFILLFFISFLGYADIYAQTTHQIWNEVQFMQIGTSPYLLSDNYILMDNIGIVTSPVDGIFTGDFDGNGYTITLDIDTYNPFYSTPTALFSVVGVNGVIRNINVDGIVEGSFVAGIVCFLLDNATIENCINNCNIIGTADVAGIVAYF